MFYLKFMLRNIVKQKGYSFINIFGLAIGIAVCSLIFLWVQDELSYDKYHENLDNIHQVVLNCEGEWWNSSNWALSPILKRDYPEIEKATRYDDQNLLIKYKDNSINIEGALVDEDFFDIFTCQFIKGDSKTALTEPNSIVITESTANKFFGSEDPTGKTLKIENALDLTVTGVIADLPSNSTFQFNYLAPVKLIGEKKLNSWSVESISYLLINQNTHVPDLITKISGVVMKHDTRTNQKVEVFLKPYKKVHLYSLSGTGPILYVYFYSIIAVLILLIACINFMNLATAKARKRAKEIGIRKVSGATKRNLILQFFGESLLYSLIALIIAVVLIILFLPAFNQLSGKQLELNLIENYSQVLGLGLITLLAGILSGFYPALVLSSFNPVNVLKISATSGSRKSVLRKILVISQFTATIVLIIGSLVIHKQLNYIKNKDLGFNRNQVVVIPLNNALKESVAAFKYEVKNHPGVINTTCATNIPTNVGNINPVYWEGQTTEDYQTINWVAVDYDYFETFEMQLAEGRSFSEEYSSDINNYVINEEAAKLMNMDSTVGKMFSIWENEGQIIGVVKNFHSNSLRNEIAPVVFTIDTDWCWRLTYAFVKVKPDNISSTLDLIRNTASGFAPDHPFDYFFLDDHFNRQYRSSRRIGTIFNYFSYIAIFISCLGLFGLTTYMVRQRTKEIGIRKILGASKSYITMLLLKEFLLLILIANIIAWPLAYLVARQLMSSYVYQTGITIWLFLGAGFMVMLLAFLTISFQTFKAASSNPVDSLRYE